MSISHRILLIFVLSLSLGGCATQPMSFLGASFAPISYTDIRKRDVPLRLKLTVEFQRNGEHFPKGDVPLKDYATRILKDAGVISPVEDRQEGEVKVVLNNIADRGTVAAEQSGARHPLWMIGTTITDAYELSIFITSQGKTIGRTGIRHAVHTALGNISIPDYIQTFPHDQAFGKVLEQMILRGLQSMQKSGELAKLNSLGAYHFGKQIG
ncbi:hypothetical protein [Nitrosovibrio tenuis]|uniref:Lipoprotein n=1 Tax=Nitrosovibrio tenuis TaxID=1233 RepID=A0A1H7IK01_9PROT|nr:hypothetical protein [Nitrosovibrio tenuis]SEK62796.1 hypothetical protein SAMN05216387_102202 [Nitrosovibrio tenuis]